MLQELEQEIEAITRELSRLQGKPASVAQKLREKQLEKTKAELKKAYKNPTPADKVYLARKKERPGVYDYIDALFEDFFEQKGDRLSSEDRSIVGGIALYKSLPVTVIGHQKGRTLQENVDCRFGMPGPDGYRKVLRLIRQAEKFGRPIITFVDTPGAYPGIEAEERGQGEAIARCLAQMSALRVPVVSLVTGEGGSGGALAISVANSLLMLQNAVYAILSPEGFASILWKDATRHGEACELMKLTAQDLRKAGIVDEVIAEPLGGAHTNAKETFANVDAALQRHLALLLQMSGEELAEHRMQKFRQIGSNTPPMM